MGPCSQAATNSTGRKMLLSEYFAMPKKSVPEWPVSEEERFSDL
jgi:hypothetical protein